MPVSLQHLRTELIPGVREAYLGTYSNLPSQWDRLFAAGVVAEPLLSIPVSPLAAAAIGAAAAVIQNPTTVSRRFIFGL